MCNRQLVPAPKLNSISLPHFIALPHTPDQAMDASADTIAEETLFALETRLRRLEFVLQGSSGDPISELHALGGAGQRNSVSACLNALERDLIRLSAKSPTVKDMLDLHANFPEIFGNVHPVIQTSTLSSEEKLSTILSAAPSFHATSSQLTSIMDTPVPSPSTSADLIGLAPRINKVEVVQQAQAKEIGELRKRSAKLLERWYLLGIEGVNECFAEWDERTLEVDKLISRKIKVVGDS